ncbi:MAG: ankyrin repeat domain-containing protein [Planctomycetaceae bacterium]|nr:ankyrin repeat domain-containing protein [Planctomycetaceae bacterium]
MTLAATKDETPAARNEEQEEIDRFTRILGKDVKAKDNDGKTLLHKAAMMGSAAVIKYLIDKNADINAKDNKGVTPLYEVAYKGHLEAVKLLLSKGGNVHAKNNDNWSILHAAVYGNPEVFKYLVSNGETPLYLAAGMSPDAQAGKNRIEIARFLLFKSADINTKNNDGKTRPLSTGQLLRITSRCSSFSLTKAQLSKTGMNLLTIAKEKEYKEITDYLQRIRGKF